MFKGDRKQRLCFLIDCAKTWHVTLRVHCATAATIALPRRYKNVVGNAPIFLTDNFGPLQSGLQRDLFALQKSNVTTELDRHLIVVTLLNRSLQHRTFERAQLVLCPNYVVAYEKTIQKSDRTCFALPRAYRARFFRRFFFKTTL